LKIDVCTPVRKCIEKLLWIMFWVPGITGLDCSGYPPPRDKGGVGEVKGVRGSHEDDEDGVIYRLKDEVGGVDGSWKDAEEIG
jgi:hypothetical protein